MEKPILFSTAMVQAIIAGRKTQTRRICKNEFQKPICGPGDVLWVRETWRPIYPQQEEYNGGEPIEIDYKATPTQRMMDALGNPGWKPSIFMPYKYARLFLPVISVRKEKLTGITERDAAAEGVDYSTSGEPRIEFLKLWNELNAKRGYPFESNPYVFVYEFSVHPGKHSRIEDLPY